MRKDCLILFSVALYTVPKNNGQKETVFFVGVPILVAFRMRVCMTILLGVRAECFYHAFTRVLTVIEFIFLRCVKYTLKQTNLLSLD